MPKKIEYFRNEKGQTESREVGQDENALLKGKAQDASGLGSRVSGSAFKPPKMEQGESSSSYAARVASARREHEAAQVAGQKKALKEMK